VGPAEVGVAEVFSAMAKSIETSMVRHATGQRRVMTAVELCRTAALGGQIEQCDQWSAALLLSAVRQQACRMQSLARAEWIEDRQAELLNCEYFHVVFTVPDKIAAIAYQNKEVVY